MVLWHLDDDDYKLLDLTKNENRIVVINKTDQEIKVDIEGIAISAKNNDINKLITQIKKMFELGKIIDNNDYILTNARQTMLLQRASQAF